MRHIPHIPAPPPAPLLHAAAPRASTLRGAAARALLALLLAAGGLWGCEGEEGGAQGGGAQGGGAQGGGAQEGGAQEGGAQEGGAQEGGAQEGGAQEGGAQEGGAQELALIGVYADEFGSTHEVSAEAWVITYPGSAPSRFWFEEVNNDERSLLARNDAANEYSPNLYSRFDWVVLQGSLWFCQTTFDSPTLDAARATPRAEEGDPAAGGCNTFPWSKLTPAP